MTARTLPQATTYATVCYVRGPTTIHGPFHNVTREQAEKLARERADRTRAIVEIATETF